MPFPVADLGFGHGGGPENVSEISLTYPANIGQSPGPSFRSWKLLHF